MDIWKSYLCILKKNSLDFAHIQPIEFQEIKQIEQPVNFTPKKTENLNRKIRFENQTYATNLQDVATNAYFNASNSKTDTQVQTEEIENDMENKLNNNSQSRCCSLV